MEGVEGPLLALTLVLMVVGLVGSVVPGLPGVTLIFLSALLYALLTDFQSVGAGVLVVLFVFAAIAFVVNAVLGKKRGKSVMFLLKGKSTLRDIAVGIGMSTLGFLAARLHLHVFDKLFLRYGKLDNFPK
jgi:hypothetical protein